MALIGGRGNIPNITYGAYISQKTQIKAVCHNGDMLLYNIIFRTSFGFNATEFCSLLTYTFNLCFIAFLKLQLTRFTLLDLASHSLISHSIVCPVIPTGLKSPRI